MLRTTDQRETPIGSGGRVSSQTGTVKFLLMFGNRGRLGTGNSGTCPRVPLSFLTYSRSELPRRSRRVAQVRERGWRANLGSSEVVAFRPGPTFAKTGQTWGTPARSRFRAVHSDSISTVPRSRSASQQQVPPLRRSPLCGDLLRSG
jgi:hypothetical protein